MRLIAHRGASGLAPENTIASFKKALEMGMKSVEFDVQLTKDNKLIVLHDYKVDRTTNGTGKVKELEWDYIKGLDAGSWFGEEYRGEGIPSLYSVLEVVKDNEFINIEVKRDEEDKRDIASYLIDTLKKFDIKDKIIVSSFDHNLLTDIYRLDKEISIALLFKKEPVGLAKYIEWLGIKVDAINPHKDSINKEYIEAIKALNMSVYTFTVNNLKECRYLESMGIDGIFTNFPNLLKGNI